jgi:hypothetical protein
MDLVLIVLGSNPAYKSAQDGFYCSSGLECFLNVVEADKCGHKKLYGWMLPRSIKNVLDIVESEMEELKNTFHMSTNQVTPDFLCNFDLEHQVVKPLTEKSPILRHILLCATQTSRALVNNDVKDAAAVHFMSHNSEYKLENPLSTHSWSKYVQTRACLLMIYGIE